MSLPAIPCRTSRVTTWHNRTTVTESSTVWHTDKGAPCSHRAPLTLPQSPHAGREYPHTIPPTFAPCNPRALSPPAPPAHPRGGRAVFLFDPPRPLGELFTGAERPPPATWLPPRISRSLAQPLPHLREKLKAVFLI